MKILFIIACILATGASPAFAQVTPKEPVLIKSGFLTGNGFRELSSSMKRGYLMGFVDATFLSPLYGAPKSEVAWLEQCAVRMTDEQMVAIVDKWLATNPARWHETMHALTLTALREACGR